MSFFLSHYFLVDSLILNLIIAIQEIFASSTKVSKAKMLKSKDITLPTRICIVKAMVFPVVMYGCENWTIKKAEH